MMRLEGRRIFVTGCAGFIGSHMVDALLRNGNEVVGVDNLSAGKMEFLTEAQRSDRFRFVKLDLLKNDIAPAMEGCDAVFHFAANPDVRQGPSNTRTHFEQNIEATFRVLEAMKELKVKNIAFPSTSTIYGEATQIPTREDYGPLVPISIYGASKLACEALISSYAYTFDMEAVIYRFANVVGSRSTHNVLHDFIHKLEKDSSRLEILGVEPGTNKSYVHVSDCVDGMLTGAKKATSKVEIYNIGSEDTLDVKGIADSVVNGMKLGNVRYDWTGGVQGGRGWIGDVKLMRLDVEHLKSKGWSPRFNSSQSIHKAVLEILTSKHL
ncbi:MAG TPA: NAD-dependent epimerase/dehydratase family protein [Methanomassiliicoccales archaeon]|jgi:UDP-glucose 4-epimerase